jgi:hypothetical protein
VRVQHTEQILHGIGHESSPLKAIAESWSGPQRFEHPPDGLDAA